MTAHANVKYPSQVPSSTVASVDESTDVTRREWMIVGGVILIVLLLTSLPYLYAYASAPADKQFMGMMLDVPDHLQYFSWMRELTHASLAANKLTPEPNPPLFFNLLWWGMGRAGAIAGLDYAIMYQIMRWIATSAFLFLAYHVCAWYLSNRRMRLTAFLAIVLTSGFGWVLILMKYTVTNGMLLWPLDVFVAEGNTFLSALGYPHFLGAAVYIGVFDLCLRGQAKGRLRYMVFGGLLALFLGWQHAYDLVIVYSILALYALLLWIRDRRLPVYLLVGGIILGFLSVWPALYSVLLTSRDPIWKAVLAQFANAGVYTPPLYRLPVLLGPAFLLALFTAIRQNPFKLKGVDNKSLFLRSWFWGNMVLVYLPVDYQIHMLNGWQVPIAILATIGLFTYLVPAIQGWGAAFGRSWNSAAIQNWTVVALLIIIMPTNLYLFAWRFTELARHDYPYFLHNDDVSALKWLEANANGDDVVFSSLDFGQYVPAYTGAHAFLAHWAQTVDFFHKSEIVSEFYSGKLGDADRREVFEQFSVDYVVLGTLEQALGTVDVSTIPDLRPVFESPSVTVFARTD